MKDITNKWINTNRNKRHKIKKYKIGDKYIFRGKKYVIDGKHVKYVSSNKEVNFAKWLSNRIKREIVLIPRIEYPFNIKTPDYKIGRKYYDLKTITGNSNQIIYHNLRNKKEQSCNFIIDATKSALTLEELLHQVNVVFSRSDMEWVRIIAIKKDSDFVVIKK